MYSKLNHQIKYLIVSIFLLNNTLLRGQENSVNILEPTAASMSRYGEYPVNYSTGSPNISIPLYTVKSGELEVPIYLQYNSGGIRVNQEASWVGLGWDLFFGGMMSRQVNGLPDEYEDFSQTPSLSEIEDYMENNPYLPSPYLESLSKSDIDHSFQPDVYNYATGEMSGIFVLDNNNVPLPIPYANLDITLNGPLGTQTIVSNSGKIYEFREGDETEILSGASNFPLYQSTWYIHRIANPNETDEITYTYQEDGYISNASLSYSEGIAFSGEGCEIGDESLSHSFLALQASASKQKVKSTKPHQVLFKNGRLTFVLSERTDVYSHADLGNLNRLKKLDHILIEKEISPGVYNTLKTIQFEYDYFNPSGDHTTQRLKLTGVSENVFSQNQDNLDIATFTYYEENNLPPKYAFDEDFWGYANGENNSSPIASTFISGFNKAYIVGSANKSPNSSFAKTGSLRSIQYRTGGRSEFEWELNTYGAEEPAIAPVEMENVSVNTTGFDCEHDIPNDGEIPDPNCVTHKSVTFTNHAAQSVKVDYNIRYETDSNGEIEESHEKYDRGYVRLADLTTGSDLINDANINNGNQSLIVHLEKDHEYRLTIMAGCFYLDGSASLSYNSYDPEVNKYNYPTGGLRIKSITTRDLNQSFLGRKMFSYVEPVTAHSSGNLLSNRRLEYTASSHSLKSVIPSSPGGTGIDCTYSHTQTTSVMSHPTIGKYSANVMYQYVQVKDVDSNNKSKGRVEYEFLFNPDATPAHDVLISKAWRRGKEIAKTIYNESDQKVAETLNYYSIDSRVNGGSIGLRAYKHNNYESICGICDPEGVLASDVYEFLTYAYPSQWIHLDKTINYDYSGGLELKSEVVYEYENPSHTQPTKVTSTTSTGENQQTVSKYPLDYTSGLLEQMKSKNMVAIPIELKKWIVDGDSHALVEGQLYEYNTNLYGHIVLDKTHRLEVNNSKAIFSESKDSNNKYTEVLPGGSDAAYYQIENKILYNDRARIVEVLGKDEVPVSYIWGYDHSYPIAKIENATKEDIQIAVSNLETSFLVDLAESTDTSEIEVSLSYLRTEVATDLPNAIVTTYTYDPLIGMKTQTDPNENQIAYEYDDFGRLKFIKDDNGNIVKKYNYQYQNSSN